MTHVSYLGSDLLCMCLAACVSLFASLFLTASGRKQLSMNRASVAWAKVVPAVRKYVEAFGAAVRSIISSQSEMFTFSSACSPASTSTLLEYDSFACLPVR